MLHIALALMVSTSQPQQQRQDWTWIAAGLTGSAASIALFWKYIWDDEPNQPPKLFVVPPLEQDYEFEQYDEPEPEPEPEAIALVPVPTPIAPQIAPQQPSNEPQFPDIDWDAEPLPKRVEPPIQQPQNRAIDLPALARQLNLPLHLEPGEVDFGKITRLPFEERKSWLVDYLAEYKLEYLLKLLQATPIAIFGLERCGKNTFACTVAALRRVFFPMPMIACSPHRNADNPFPAFFQTVGYDEAANYRAIAAHLKGVRRWVELGDTMPVTTLWDESSSYQMKFDKADQHLLNGFTLFCMTECAKHEKFQIIMASGTTNTCLPGADGTARDRNKGMIGVFRQVKTDAFGRKSPSPRIEIEGISSDLGKQEFVFPSWMNARWVLSAFPEANRAIELPEHLAEVCKVQAGSQTVQVSSETVQLGSNVVPFRTPEPRSVQPLNPAVHETFSDSPVSGSVVQEVESIVLNLDSDEKLSAHISELRRAGLNQDQVILAIWGAKKGGNKAYQSARDEYRRLTSGKE